MLYSSICTFVSFRSCQTRIARSLLQLRSPFRLSYAKALINYCMFNKGSRGQTVNNKNVCTMTRIYAGIRIALQYSVLRTRVSYNDTRTVSQRTTTGTLLVLYHWDCKFANKQHRFAVDCGFVRFPIAPVSVYTSSKDLY